jgi:5-formyltetrahydrofolate cyclo-ligase
MGEDHAQAKRLLRRELRTARRDLPMHEAARRSAQACERLARARGFRAARRIVLYAPLEGEVDVTPLAATVLQGGRILYYPRVTDDRLEFVRAEPATLRPGRFGVPEPPDGEPLESAALFVVPGLAFDLRGVRLGRGAGYYDRAFARNPEALRLGIAFEFQIMPRLPQAAWDVPMSAVVTDARQIGET